jgi:20S proteasome alpha/beta subunit
LDPTGQFWNCQAVAIGKESEKAERWLYNKLGQIEDGYSGCETLEKMSCEAALALLLECMESLLTSSQTTSKPALSSATKTFWQAVIQEHSTSSDKPPIRTFQRGAFLPPKNKE